jgi:diguanylate cyclase (GGDEF)-like protein
MNNILNKILNIQSLTFFKNGRSFFNDLEIINNFFNLNETQIKSDGDFNDYLVEVFARLSNQLKVNLGFYGLKADGAKTWQDLIDNKPATFSFSKYVIKNFSELFGEQLRIHEIKNEKSKASTIFLSFRCGNEYYYILETKRAAYSRQYFQLFYNGIQKILQLYAQLQEKQSLEKRILFLQRTIAEKERSLKIAERAVKRKVYDLHNLVEASNEIYSILDFKQLINSALLTIVGQVGIQSALALMYNPAKHAYDQCFKKGFKDTEINSLKVKIDSAITKYFLKYRSPVYVKNLETDKELDSYVKKLKKLKIFIIAPIIQTERLLGIIAIGEKLYGSEFTQTDFELFHVLVNIISISIENALHYEAVKNLSLTDGMTNLHNYRYFKIRLKEELNRAKRNRTKVSMLIIDIDHFKNYNDTLGHQAGDQALRNLGRVLKGTVRDEDIVSRYGGEEFCIILPGISKEGIIPLGERIRTMIEDFNFYKEKVQPTGKLTISLGGATFPEDALSPDELVQKADSALYESKNMGRNQLRLYRSQVKTRKRKSKGVTKI